ncbi:hypothetical protein [Roseovarius rhodophyticola]|uniref:Uncharacterized protein n=1 Tax=Roseovarius rhodophyticola TaxID=3080827 RepID=A0ABZ2TGC9_9RHOB|nr:hypothetical protein [Roseovarius sp. W115]MDV2930505.1 hypothetical protein [Roseovarius sp. W115]
MTQVISRLFESEKLAQGVADRLRFEGVPQRAVRVVTAKAGEGEKDLATRISGYSVAANAAKAYAKHIGSGKAAVVVHATYRPLGAAKLTRNVMDRNNPIDLGDVTEETHVPDKPSRAPSIMDSHPHFLTTRVHNRRIPSGGPVSHGVGPKLLLKHRPRTSAISGGRYMSRFFWPMPLLKKNREARSAIRGGKHMSRMFWPQKLLSTKERRLSVIPGGSLPLSRALGFPAVMTRP